jgi:hypothetical protein
MRLLETQAHLLTRISADSFLAMFDEQKGGQKQTAMAAAINAVHVAQAEVDRLFASIAAGEQAIAAEQDAAVLGVLARRQVQQEQLLAAAKAKLLDAQVELQQLQTNPSLRVVAAEAQEKIARLMQTFDAEADTVSDRRAVQRHFQRIGLKVHIDGQEQCVGLRIVDGPIDWQPLAPIARRRALAAGIADPPVAEDRRGSGSFVIGGDGTLIHTPADNPFPADGTDWEAEGRRQGRDDAMRLLWAGAAPSDPLGHDGLGNAGG